MTTARASQLSWSIALLLVAAGIGFASPVFIDVLRAAGRHIPQANMEYDYLVGLLWATVVGLSILAWPVPQSDKRPLAVLWGAKVFVTLVAMLAYEWNYDLDAYGYFHRSRLPALALIGGSWYLGNDTVTRFVWLHGRIIPESYHALKVTFALIGLVAVYLFYRGVVRYRGVEDRRILYILGLFPSILFWSSIIGKDPIQLLGIALYVYGVLSWRMTGRNVHAVTIAVGVTLAFFIRSWSAPILLFPLAVFAAFGLRHRWGRVFFGIAAVVGFAWTTSLFAEKFGIETLHDVHVAAESRSVGWEGGSARTDVPRFDSPGGMLWFAPWGAFTALFRPLPGEVLNPFGFLAGIENAFLLGLLFLAVVRTRVSRFRDPVLAWAVALILTWSFVYSFVSYYNFGAAVRFKLQILPLLLLVLLHLSRRVTARASPVAGQPGPGSVLRQL